MKFEIIDKKEMTIEMAADEDIFVISGGKNGQFGKWLKTQHITPEFIDLFNRTKKKNSGYEFIRVIEWDE